MPKKNKREKERKFMTNFEKIKAMDVGELAEVIAGVPYNDNLWTEICEKKHCKLCNGDLCDSKFRDIDCPKAVKHWLESSAEG